MALNKETLIIIHNLINDEKAADLSNIDRFNDSVTPEQRQVLQDTKKWVEGYFIKADSEGRTRGGHGFDHSRRNAGYAAFLAKSEGQNTFIPVLTAMLVDVGRAVDDPRSGDWRHGQLSAEIVESYVQKIDLLTEDEKIDVVNAVREHSNPKDSPDDSFLVKIIKDADRLDFIGMTGFVRSAAHRHLLPISQPSSGAKTEERGVKTYLDDAEDLLSIERFQRPDRILHFPAARFLAAMRWEYFHKALESLKNEINGVEDIAERVVGKD